MIAQLKVREEQDAPRSVPDAGARVGRRRRIDPVQQHPVTVLRAAAELLPALPAGRRLVSAVRGRHPLPDGHRTTCSGHRPLPAGTRGGGCCCRRTGRITGGRGLRVRGRRPAEGRRRRG